MGSERSAPALKNVTVEKTAFDALLGRLIASPR